MSGAAPRSAGQEWRESWPLAVASLAGMTIASITLYVVGPLMAPIEQETGWSRAQIALGLSLSSVCGALFAPLAGLLLDRWGPRRIGLPGAVLCLGTLALIGLAPNTYALYLALWFVISLGAVGVMPTVWTMAIASSFEKARGLAMAVALCGSSVAALVMPLLSTWAIDTYGWRTAVPIINGIIGMVTLPILFFAFRSRADRQHHDAGMANDAPAAPAPGVTSVRAAVLSPQFVKLTLAAFLFTVCSLGMVSNMVPVITSLGFGRTEAAAIAGLLGLASFTGRMTTGFLIDRFDSNRIAGALVALPVISCALLLNVDGSAAMAAAAVLVLGLSLGAEVDVIAYLAAEKFGTARFGTIFGFITSGWIAATAVGPLLVSLTYDLSGGYLLAIKLAIPVYVVVSVLLFTLGKPLPFEGEASA